jgi:hypothetical protein
VAVGTAWKGAASPVKLLVWTITWILVTLLLAASHAMGLVSPDAQVITRVVTSCKTLVGAL